MNAITRCLFMAPLMVMSLSLAAQEKSMGIEPDTVFDGTAYQIVEEMPEYPGGLPALFQYLGGNTTYPQEAKDKGYQGTVYLQFVLDTAGYVDTNNITVLQGVHPLLDEEAVRVVKGMPRWTPGRQRGKAVSVYFKLPLKFTLQKPDKKKKRKKK